MPGYPAVPNNVCGSLWSCTGIHVLDHHFLFYIDSTTKKSPFHRNHPSPLFPTILPMLCGDDHSNSKSCAWFSCVDSKDTAEQSQALSALLANCMHAILYLIHSIFQLAYHKDRVSCPFISCHIPWPLVCPPIPLSAPPLPCQQDVGTASNSYLQHVGL